MKTTKRLFAPLVVCALALLAFAVPAQAEFGIEPGTLQGKAIDREGNEYTQAGGHPYEARAWFTMNQHLEENWEGTGASHIVPDGRLRNVVVDIPPGFIGNPSAVPRCPLESFSVAACSPESQVGYIDLELSSINEYERSPIYNLVPPAHHPAQFGFAALDRTITILANARTDGDFGIRTLVKNIVEAAPVLYSKVTIWGVPGDPSHNELRTRRCIASFTPSSCSGGNQPFKGPVKPFISMGTDCNDLSPTTSVYMDEWKNPADLENMSHPSWLRYDINSPAVEGCEKLTFDPSIQIQPSIANSDSPTGVSVALDVPQNENPVGLSTPHLKKAVVTLPEGMTINPAAADGIQGCSPQQLGITSYQPLRFTKTDSNCPQASKVGTVEVTTPLLPDVFKGDAYVATPYDNPFNSLVSLYFVLRGPGLVVKLAGKVEPDPVTGQLRTTFDQNPQLTFDEFRLNFFGGPRAALATPQTCGTKAISSEMTPWSAPQSGPPALRSNSYTSNAGPNHGPCSASTESRPFAPGLAAGTTNPVAGAKSPFTVRLTRPDGHQELAGLTVKTPKGFAGYLKGIPYCSEEAIAAAGARKGIDERNNPSCSQASRVGSLFSGAGAGPTPLFTPGDAYLAGPYKGAPLSMVTITPALAGGTPGNPVFDLGVVVVRVALHVDPVTAEITAVSDPIPQILEGIPLRVKDIRVRLDRPDFILNPTNCGQLAVSATATGSSGATAQLTDRFQVGSCADLAFKPRISINLLGGTTRAKYQAVRAVVRPRPGDANISGAVVRFPTSAFIAQEHLNNICTRVQWANEACPRNSIYGSAEARSPLLDVPLKGHVHLRSSTNLLPDLVADLRGPAHQPIRIEVAIKNDSAKGALRNTVMAAPDAPVSFFRLQTFGGKKGLIVNSRNICRGNNNARATFRAHNGRRSVQSVPVRNARCAKQRKAAKR